MGPLEKEVSDLRVYVERELSDLKQCFKEVDVRADHLEKDNIRIKANLDSTNTRVNSLETTLKEISDNTKWIKRTITKAGISAAFTVVVGGLIALVGFYFTSLGG